MSSPSPPAAPWPGVLRRLACFVYEGVLLFGVVTIAGYLYSSLTQQRHALEGRHGLQAFLFVVLGIYFAWFWSKSGQTVAMKAWHLRVVDAATGAPPGQGRALLRYLFAWLWFAPALLALWLSGLRGGGIVTVLLVVGVAAYAIAARLHPQRQFLHDLIAGTRIVDARPAPRPAGPAAAEPRLGG